MAAYRKWITFIFLTSFASLISLDTKIEESIQVEKVETLDEIAFRTGYERGKRNMLAQMGITEEKSVTDDYNLNHLKIEDQEKFKAIYMKAYVEGYQKTYLMFVTNVFIDR